MKADEAGDEARVEAGDKAVVGGEGGEKTSEGKAGSEDWDEAEDEDEDEDEAVRRRLPGKCSFLSFHFRCLLLYILIIWSFNSVAKIKLTVSHSQKTCHLTVPYCIVSFV